MQIEIVRDPDSNDIRIIKWFVDRNVSPSQTPAYFFKNDLVNIETCESVINFNLRRVLYHPKDTTREQSYARLTGYIATGSTTSIFLYPSDWQIKLPSWRKAYTFSELIKPYDNEGNNILRMLMDFRARAQFTLTEIANAQNKRNTDLFKTW